MSEADNTTKLMDKKINQAFTKATADLHSYQWSIGLLSDLKTLFPSKFGSSLTTLSKLTARPRSASTISTTAKLPKPKPSFKVVLGVGKAFSDATQLFRFFNSLLEFETETVYSTFVEQGYSIVITGGNHNSIVAAAVFMVASDGIFVDALAVSTGHHENSIALTDAVFEPADVPQVNFFLDIKDGSFRRLGLGSLLLALISRCAILRCKDSPGVFLKAHKRYFKFYKEAGFDRLGKKDTLPAQLLRIVPKVNRAVVKKSTTFLMGHTPKATGPHDEAAQDAAAALAAMAATEAPPPNTPSPNTPKQGKRPQDPRPGQEVTKVSVELFSDHESDADYDTYPIVPDAGSGWTLPDHDYWEPQSKPYKRFKATAPEDSHLPTQKEVIAKHGGEVRHALGRLKLIRKAQEYKSDTQFMQSLNTKATDRKYSIAFTDQAYLTLAAVADLNRPIQIHTDKLEANNNEVLVSVSSYILPKKTTLQELIEDEDTREALKPKVLQVKVSVPWLMQTTRPDIAKWIEDSLFGTKVQRVHGSNLATDPLDLSFSGKNERDKEFVSAPQGHVQRSFRPNPRPSSAEAKAVKGRLSVRQKKGPLVLKGLRPVRADASSIAYYDIQGNATETLCAILKEEATKLGIEYLSPPPQAATQVVKLKWVPTKQLNKDPKEHGVWHGAFAVRVGTDKSTTVLQECGLLREWVENQFAPPLLEECKKVSAGEAGKRNPKHYLYIPAGDVHDTNDDPPPTTELLLHVTVPYLQGEEDSCLRMSMASALSAMGFESEAKEVASQSALVGCRLELIQKATVLVTKVFGQSNLVLKKLHNHASSVAEIAKEDASWPILLIIQTGDGCYGTHAVTTWNQMIFDSNCVSALRWSQKSLDWCSGKDSTCVGFSRAYRICPANLGQTQPQSTISIGAHVLSQGAATQDVAWVMRLPSKKRKGYHVRHTDGKTETLSMENVNRVLVPSSTVGGLQVVQW